MKEFEIDLQYLEHDGGSKFYETVVLTEKVISPGGSAALGPSILIQRWGRIALNTGGGSTKIVKGTANLTGEARNKILNEKRGFRTGKGQYLDKTSPFFGFGRVGRGGIVTISGKEMMHMMTEHYDRENQEIIAGYFGYTVGDELSDEEDDIVEEGLDENERGPNWASW